MLYFFQDSVLFCMENTKLLAYFILLRIFALFGEGLNDALVYQNWQIEGVPDWLLLLSKGELLTTCVSLCEKERNASIFKTRNFVKRQILSLQHKTIQITNWNQKLKELAS